MGYFAITSGKKNLIVSKTSETIFIERRSTYCFFEIELKRKDGKEMTSGKYSVSVMIPGKVLSTTNAESILQDPSFLPWYYSQKQLIKAGVGRRVRMNDYFTKIVISEVSRKYDRMNNVSQLDISLVYDQGQQEPVRSLHTFFTLKSRGNVVSHRGNIFAESRYFDKKLCPKGDFFDNNILSNTILDVQRIYCWFIIPKGYLANDYTSFNKFSPRDARLIEPEYNILLNGRHWARKWWNCLTDRVQGRPQVINWVLEKNKGAITFHKNLKEVGKWDDIRLFVSCVGFPLTNLFLFIAGASSIIGVILAILVLWITHV